jgi:hypothetical protein
MRYVFLVVLMTSAMIGLITWATRPDMVATQYNKVAAPIEKHFSDKRAAQWQAAKEQAWKQRIAQVRLPNDCSQPATSLRALECKNQLQLHADAFEREWNSKIASGWQPDSMN